MDLVFSVSLSFFFFHFLDLFLSKRTTQTAQMEKKDDCQDFLSEFSTLLETSSAFFRVY